MREITVTATVPFTVEQVVDVLTSEKYETETLKREKHIFSIKFVPVYSFHFLLSFFCFFI